jgi:hypothetical protein
MGYRWSCFEYIFLLVKLNVVDGQYRRFEASEKYVNGVEVFNFEYYSTTFSIAVPKFAARMCGVFEYGEVAGDKS